MADFTARNFRIVRKNTLIGFCEIETPGGMILVDVALHEKNGRNWLSMPARQFEKPDGEKGWSAYIKFRVRETGDKFQSAALPAVLRALGGAEGNYEL
jgi:hypothetical protein